jgi:hypothetical protein
MLCVWGAPAASAQNDNTPPTSRGENFSNKPAPALFQADCTGGGCHKGPQGLAKGQSQGSLAGFLREHYTNSRESAAALSAYLLKLPPAPAQPSPRAASTRETPPSAPARSGPSWFDPDPGEARPPRQQQQQQQRPARAAARSGEDAAPTPPAAVPSAPAAAEPPARPAREPRNQRGRQQPTAAAAPTPAPEAAPPPPPPAPPPPQWDIFD